MAKTNLKIWLGLAISLACLVYVLREIDFARLWKMLRGVNPLYVIAVNLLYGLSLVIRTWRWQGLMRPVMADPPFKPLFSANLIGFMANNILPARLGELARAWTSARLAGVPVSSSLATILVERMLDVPVLLGFLVGMLFFLEPGGQAEGLSVEYLRGAGYSLLTGYVIALAIITAVVAWPHRMIGLLGRLAAGLSPRLGQRLQGLLTSFVQGLASLRSPRALLNLLLLSVLVRLPILGMHFVFLPAVGLEQGLFLAAMAALGHGLALTIPAAPGYIGTYQLGVFWALLLAGAPRKEALAYAVIFWAAQYFPLVLAGLIEIYRHGLALSSLAQRGEELASQENQPGNSS